MSIDKESAKVTMSLKDYEKLVSYEGYYYKLINGIKSFAHINELTSDSATIVIEKEKAEQFIVQFVEDDFEFDGIEDNIKVKWK